MPGEWGLRVRALCATYLPILAAVCLLFVAVGGAVAYDTYTGPDVRTETQQVSTWQSTGAFDYRAVVRTDTAVYATGDVLRNRTTYFREVTPVLNGSLTYTYSASEGGNLQADAIVVLVLRSVAAAEDGSGETYWSSESVLTTRRVSDLGPGDRLTVPFSVNVSRAAQRLAAIDEQFGGTPGDKQILIETRVRLSGTRNGANVDQTRVYRLPIQAIGSVYRVDDPGTVTASGGRQAEVTVPVSPGPLRSVGAPVLAVVGFLGLALLGGGWYEETFVVSDQERAWLDHRSQRQEFDEWITVATCPDEPDSVQRVEVASLKGLVNIAIDTDQRVLEDRDRDRFVVLSDWVTYTYTPPSSPDANPVIETPASKSETTSKPQDSDNERSSPDPLDPEFED